MGWNLQQWDSPVSSVNESLQSLQSHVEMTHEGMKVFCELQMKDQLKTCINCDTRTGSVSPLCINIYAVLTAAKDGYDMNVV